VSFGRILVKLLQSLYVLASKTPGMSPEQAMLAGLMQDIGAIPILNYIEKYPEFMKLDYKIDAIINTLKSRIGAQILESWGFSSDLIEVAKNSNNWAFQSPHEAPNKVNMYCMKLSINWMIYKPCFAPKRFRYCVKVRACE
jgi:HD-like signal output (HDOD) protein